MKTNFQILAVLAGVVVVALLGGGYFLGVAPGLSAAAAADESTASALANNQTLQVKLAALTKAAAKTAELEEEAAVLAKNVPTSLKPNTFVRRVNEVAAINGVSVQSVTVGTAQSYTPPPAVQAVAAAAAAEAAAAAAPSTEPTAAAAPAPAAVSAPILAATDAAITGANFTVVPVSLAVKGLPDSAMEFVHDIQRDERTFLVSTYTSAVSDDDASVVSATMTGFIYTLAP